MNTTYTCTRCGGDMEYKEGFQHRCESCGLAHTVSPDADYVDGRFRDASVVKPVICDCHMRSQFHEPMCPNVGPTT